jgi:peptidoglycan/LPS O-acetylase OafA/YrhL
MSDLMPTNRIDEIDGLRALAMTMVIAQHCGLAPMGWTGVWLFFVISGYVISRNFIQQEYSDKSPFLQYKLFMIRRFFRIVPVYFLYIFMNLCLLSLISQFDSFKEVPFLLTFTYNWQMIFQFWPLDRGWSSFGHLWTLSIEEQFYLIYPILFLFFLRKHYLVMLIILVVLGPFIRLFYSIGLSVVSNDEGWKAFAIYASSFAQFDAFLIGCLIANFEGETRKRPWIAHALLVIASLSALTYALVYMGINLASGAKGIDLVRNIFSGILYGHLREVFVYSVIDLLAAAVLVYSILQMRVTRPLGWGPLALIGRISYGGYLYHALVLWLVGEFVIGAHVGGLPVLERIGWFAVVWAMTCAVAYISFTRFEKPIMDWTRQSRNMEPSIVGAMK